MALSPDMLGPFELLRRLGAGGMAETFLAVRRGPAGFEQRVCIKRILPAYEFDRDFVASFLAEARMSASLRHANIAQVVDFGFVAEQNSHYLALELIDGLDLRALMQRDPMLDHELVTLIAAEIAAALSYAHHGDQDHPAVVHRDVSPSNVLISRNGEVKLTDFGIARVVGGSLHTASGIIKGKVPYMPPEYIDGGHFDERGDLFALGVMMYELLHGYRPYDGNSEIETLRRIASGERRPFTANAPSHLELCVEQLIAPHPDQRFRDARDLLDALPPIHVHRVRKRLAELVRARTSQAPLELTSGPWGDRTQPITPSTPITPPVPIRAPARRTGPSRMALLALAASSLLLIAVTVAVLLTKFRPTTTVAVPQLPEPPPVAAQPQPVVPSAPEPSGDDWIVEREVPKEVPQPQPEPTPVKAPDAQKPRDDRKAIVRPAPPPARQNGELTVVVVPFGEIWIDGKLVGQSPQQNLKLSPGEHEIAVGEGRPSERRKVEVVAGEHADVVFQSPRRQQN